MVVAGILLALEKMKQTHITLDSLTGETKEGEMDGEKIYKHIQAQLKSANLSPEVKREKILLEFAVIKNSTKINEIHPYLQCTPLKHYVRFIKENIFDSIHTIKNSYDYLSVFYSEFMRFSGGDGQTLGIVLTPNHITELFCDLADLKKHR